MDNILISIIVPVFNVEAYIYKCISSLTSQLIKDIEIICINDCSTDNSLYILEKLAKKDSRIKIINNEKNLGVAKSRNIALEVAKGEYIGFVDGDDYVRQDFFYKLYRKAKENDSDIVKGSCKMVMPNGELREHWYNRSPIVAKKKKKFLPAHYSHGFWLSIYKRKLFEENELNFPDLTNGEDVVFLMKALTFAEKFDYVENTFYYYYQRPDSASYMYKAENVEAVAEHFIHQIEFLNSLNLEKKYYVDYIRERIFPAFEFWVLKFLRLGVSEELCKEYVESLFALYKLCKYKEVFRDKNYLASVKKENVENYIKDMFKSEFKFCILRNIPLLIVETSTGAKKVSILKIPVYYKKKKQAA